MDHAVPAAGRQPSPERIFQMLNAYQQTAALKAAIELDLFTAIGEGNVSPQALAKRCSAAERGVRILCDYLVVHGMLDKNGKAPTDAGFDASHISQYGYVSENNSQEGYWNFIGMNGGTFLDKKFGQNFLFDQPQSVQALQYLVDLVNKYHVSPPATETNNNGIHGGHQD